jgi:hypothetical protein
MEVYYMHIIVVSSVSSNYNVANDPLLWDAFVEGA